ncbi:MAG: hypothetical protein FWD09_05315 [Lentimicrobiaceae bacterium]|nr:hypothetical protein [Lentimicrobiaceae bacterium]
MNNFRKENRIFSKKTILTLFAITALCVSVSAQRQIKAPNEFSIFGGGAYTFIYFQQPFDGVHGISSKGFGADLGVSFTAFAGKYVGFHIGLGMGTYNIKALVDSFTFVTPNYASAPNLFGDDQPYDLYTTLSGYKEKHTIYFLTIPLMLQFQTVPKSKSAYYSGIKKSFYAMTGVKLNFLIKKQYEVEIEELKNIAHFTQLDNWAGTQIFAGLGRFKGNTSYGQHEIFMPVFTFEAGIKWFISNNANLYTGAYFDCGLNDPTKSIRKPASNYTSENKLADLSLLEFYNNSFLMGVGIKLRLAFFNSSKYVPCR